MSSTLKHTLDWIETFAQRRALSEQTQETAAVIARRSLKDDRDQNPRIVARDAVDEALTKYD